MGNAALETTPSDATAHFEKAIAIFKEIKAPNDLPLAYSGMDRLHKSRDEYAEERQYLTQAVEIFERLRRLVEPDKATMELVELPSGS